MGFNQLPLLSALADKMRWHQTRQSLLAENVANAELFPDHDDPLHDRTFRVTKFQLGYARRIAFAPFELALGGSASAYAKPAALDPYYGDNPIGVTVFAKLSLGG